jgi:hypothetical protein
MLHLFHFSGKVRSAGLEAGAVRGLQALRATLLTAVEAARDGELQEVRPGLVDD